MRNPFLTVLAWFIVGSVLVSLIGLMFFFNWLLTLVVGAILSFIWAMGYLTH